MPNAQFANSRTRFYPVSTDKPFPILTFTKDANMPTTGTKVRDYFFIQNHRPERYSTNILLDRLTEVRC